MSDRAASPGRSPARCSCSVSWPPRKPGCILIFTHGRRPPSRPGLKAANAKRRAPSMHCSPPAMADPGRERATAVTAFDPRVTPARPDLAARHLQGQVNATRFVDGTAYEVVEGQAPVRRAPAPDAALETEALCGERVTIYETEEGWAWGQLESDHYVGFMPASALAAPG